MLIDEYFACCVFYLISLLTSMLYRNPIALFGSVEAVQRRRKGWQKTKDEGERINSQVFVRKFLPNSWL